MSISIFGGTFYYFSCVHIHLYTSYFLHKKRNTSVFCVSLLDNIINIIYYFSNYFFFYIMINYEPQFDKLRASARMLCILAVGCRPIHKRNKIWERTLFLSQILFLPLIRLVVYHILNT